MIAKIKRELLNFNLQVGTVRISTDELIDVLDDEAFNEIGWKAVIDDYLFSNLDDMKINRLHLAGRPIVWGNFEDGETKFSIDFNRGVRIQSTNIKNENSLQKIQLLGVNLKKYRTLFYIKGLDISWSRNWVGLIIASAVLISMCLGFVISTLTYSSDLFLFNNIDYFFIALGLLFIIPARASVYNYKKPNIINRIADKVLLHFITFVLGAVLTYLATKHGYMKL